MSIMSHIPAGLTRSVGRALLKAQKGSPTVLFIGGVVGVVATTVLASRATLKVHIIIEDAQDDLSNAKDLLESDHPKYSNEDYQRDRVYIYARATVAIAKLYGPAIIVGVTSIGFLTGSHNILTRRNASLTAAYAALEKGFDEYRSRVVQQFGSEQDLKFRHGSSMHEILEDTSEGPVVTTVARVGTKNPSVYARFFDEACTDWSRVPEYNRIFLDAQQNYANDLLRRRGHVFLNEIYDMLGLERTRAGAVVGWLYNGTGDNFIDFGIFRDDDIRFRDFVNGREGSVLIDPNVDGMIYDKI
jgi:hypothetical protein